MAEPYRILDLSSFAGDAWATRTAQAVPPDALARLVISDFGSRSPFRVKVIPVDAVSATANQVVDTVTTIDFRVVKLFDDGTGAEKTELLESVVETTGSEGPVGGGFTEVDVDPSDIVVPGFPTIKTGPGSAAALLIYVLREQRQV